MSQLLAIATRAKSRAPMRLHTQALVSSESGLVTDSRGKPGKRQVTVLSKSQWQQACDELGTNLEWTLRRANLLVSDIEFGPTLMGKRLKIGDLVLEISAETEPCERMDEQFNGLTAALEPDWRGGACCRVIEAGTVKQGDKVELLD